MPRAKKEETEKVPEKKEATEEKVKKETKKPSEADFVKKVVELGKQGLTSEKIGLKLKQEGIHVKDYGKKISKILQENSIYINTDIKNIETKLDKIVKHYGKNKQDKRAMRDKDRIFSQLRKLKKYFGIPLK